MYIVATYDPCTNPLNLSVIIGTFILKLFCAIIVEFTNWGYSVCVVWWISDGQDWTQAVYDSL